MRAGEQGHDPPATDVKGAPKRTKHRHPLNKHPGPRAPAAEKWSQVALARARVLYLTRAACLSADVMEFMWSKGRPPNGHGIGHHNFHKKRVVIGSWATRGTRLNH